MAKTETAQLQEYIDQIYGNGFYRVEYIPFKGFYARSLGNSVQPHAQFLGNTSGHAHAHLDEMAALKESQVAEQRAAGF